MPCWDLAQKVAKLKWLILKIEKNTQKQQQKTPKNLLMETQEIRTLKLFTQKSLKQANFEKMYLGE